MFVPFHSDIQPDQPEMLMDGSWGSLTPLGLCQELWIFTTCLDSLWVIPAAHAHLQEAFSSHIQNSGWRIEDRSCAISVPRSVWCLYSQRSPLLGSFLHEVIQFRCLFWGSSHWGSFKFAPFPESSGKDPTVPCLDGTSASWVQVVSCSCPRNSVGAQGCSQPRLHQLSLETCLSSQWIVLGFLKHLFLPPRCRVNAHTTVFSDLLEVILLARESCSLIPGLDFFLYSRLCWTISIFKVTFRRNEVKAVNFVFP